MAEFTVMVEKAQAWQRGDRAAFLDVVTKVAEKQARSKSRFARLYIMLKAFGERVEKFGVKLKILISLFQVLSEMGSTFVIQYPSFVNDVTGSTEAFEIELPSLLRLHFHPRPRVPLCLCLGIQLRLGVNVQ